MSTFKMAILLTLPQNRNFLSVSNSFKSETATFGVKTSKPAKNRPNFLFPKTATFLAQSATILNYRDWILPNDLIRSLTDFTEIRSLKKYT